MIGNLTLTGYNPEMSNRSFQYKKENFYEKSNYALTRGIATNVDWTSFEIIERSKTLAKLALKIWSLPSVYNTTHSVDTGVTYNFKADLNLFQGTKPNLLSYCGEEVSVTNWRDVLLEVIRRLYQLNPELLIKLLQTKRFIGRKTFLCLESEVETAPSKVEQINEGEEPKYYIYTNNNTEISLMFLRDLMIYFEKDMDIELIDNIWFTLRRV